MSRVDFDEPKLKEMDDFLKYIYDIGKNNPSIDINKWLVYRELCKYKLDPDEIKSDGEYVCYSDLFQKWIKRNNEVDSRSKGLILEHEEDWPAFLQYYSSDGQKIFKSKDYIKMYIPLKYKDLFSSVNVLFDYIRDAKITHMSKIAHKVRSDNVIVILSKEDLESAKKIISFIANNNTIKNNLNSTNPFVPTVNGIGLIIESNFSYNSEIANLIANYINVCIKRRKKPMISAFYKWIKNNNISSELEEIFSYAIATNSYIEVEKKNK